MPGLAMEAFLNQHITSPWGIEPIRRGVVNACWKVTTQQRSYMLKLQGAVEQFGINSTGIQRADEVRLQRWLNSDAKSGSVVNSILCPDIVAVSEDYQWVLYTWVDAGNLAENATLNQAEKMQVLGQTLYRIHQQTPDIPRWSLAERLQTYLAACSEPLAKHYEQLLAPLKQWVQAWDNHLLTLCHNDLALEHILMTDPVSVVDWEYAGYGHPFFDLASAIAINKLDATQQAQLCNAYYAASGMKVDTKALLPWCQLIKIINDLWSDAQNKAF